MIAWRARARRAPPRARKSKPSGLGDWRSGEDGGAQAGPRQPKQAAVVGGVTRKGEVRQDVADTRAELVAMAGKARRDDDVWLFGQRVNDEMLIRRVHEHAGLTGPRRAQRLCKVPLHGGQHGDVLRRDPPVDAVGIHALAAMMKLTDLAAGAVVLGNAIEITALGATENENGKALCRKLPGLWCKPADHLPLGDGQGLERLV